ncbi:MAG TPA: VOC family protein [Pyrinomonadaceae bacterium]
MFKRHTGANDMFLGLRTVVYYVDDIDKAKLWYSSVLDQKPYFDESFYVGFNVGGFELGLHPNDGRKKGEGHVAYWGVENAESTFKQLLDLGASEHEVVQDVGGGIKVATVKDPFGNVLGIIENPHFGK